MKLDLHVHCSERSHCGRSTADEQVRAAIAAGLDGIVFTDHGRLAPADELARFSAQYAPFLVLGGIEISIDREDVLVLGIDAPLLETRAWTYPELHAFVRGREGFLALAHPFRYRPSVGLPVGEYPPNAVEIRSINIAPETTPMIADLARSLRIPVLCNSDAHDTESLGRHYNVLDDAVRDEASLVAALRRGAFQAMTRGQDGEPDRGSRRWTVSVVESHS